MVKGSNETGSKTKSLIFNDNCTVGSLESIKYGLSFVSESASGANEGMTSEALKGLGSIVDVLRQGLEVAISKIIETQQELYAEIKRLGDLGARTVEA